jgi:CHASE2 domain
MSIAEVQFEGYNISPTHPKINLKAQIKQAIEDPRGWDILFFAGHSDEGLGGELMLAPGYSALVSEFETSLKLAREQGLQFALFNSCRGCAIAEKLIQYGLSHVVVMRERITNEVAQVFFQAFADRLAMLQDVQMAAIGATQTLANKAKDHYQYPSAYLVPSIYAYSGIQPLKPPLFNWRVVISRLNPTRREAIVLVAVAILSGQIAIQYPLIDARQLGQAIYRDLIFKDAPASPPILLVKLDDRSLNEASIRDKDPIDRGYLAQLVQKSIELKAPLVGIDYVLKDDRPKQDELRKALQSSGPTRFVMGESGKWGRTFEKVMPAAERVDGDIDVNNLSNAVQRYPVFMARTIGSPSVLPNPSHPFPQQLLCQKKQSPNCKINDSKAYYHPITQISSWLNLQWFAPWIDYSIAMSDVYDSVSAQDFLKRQMSLEDTIVLLIPSEEFDDFAKPRAMRYHADVQKPISYKMAGGEIHAYQLYNLMRRGLVMPIPDLWMIGLVGILGKLLSLALADFKRVKGALWVLLLAVVPILAYVVGFLTYRLAAISIPLFFPLLVYWSYLLPHLLHPFNHPKNRSNRSI